MAGKFSDERVFAWVRCRSAAKVDGTGDPQPVIILDRETCPRLDIVAERKLTLHEHTLDIFELVRRYPAPAPEPEPGG